MTAKPTRQKAMVFQRLSGLVADDKILVDPAALFEEPFSPRPGVAALPAGNPGRLYLLEQCAGLRRDELPETVCPADLTEWLERPSLATLDPRFLPLDHPEGIMAKFNRWFYMGLGERAFGEGLVPTGLAKDPHIVRAEAALVARLALRTGSRKPTVLKVGAGLEAETLRLFFEELRRLDADLAGRCEVTVSDYASPLVDEVGRRAHLDPILSELANRGQLRFRVLDAAKPELAGERFTLIHSSHLYDSMPQRELARVCGRWYEFKARPQLAAWPELEEFRRLILSDDLAGLREVDAHLFGYLDWQVALDPLPPEQVPYKDQLENICGAVGDVAVPLGDALIMGFEALLPYVVPGGAVQTFDLAVPDLTNSVPDDLEEMFKGPERMVGALFLNQNFTLARQVFASRGLQTNLLPADRYLEETLGEEVLCPYALWEALSLEALEELLSPALVARFRGCFEGKGGSIFRRAVEGDFLTRSEAKSLETELESLGLDGQGFVQSLFKAKERLSREGPYEQFRVEVP